eukprot:2820125-Rhodomonas_salina.1
MQSPVLSSAMLLHASYAMSGTELAYAATSACRRKSKCRRTGTSTSQCAAAKTAPSTRRQPKSKRRNPTQETASMLCRAPRTSFLVPTAIALGLCYAVPGTERAYGCANGASVRSESHLLPAYAYPHTRSSTKHARTRMPGPVQNSCVSAYRSACTDAYGAVCGFYLRVCLGVSGHAIAATQYLVLTSCMLLRRCHAPTPLLRDVRY